MSNQSSKTKLSEEIIWAISTTGDEFQCVHVDFAREQQAEIERLNTIGSVGWWQREAHMAQERAYTSEKEIERLRAALEKYGRHLDGCRTRDWTTGEKSWDAATCDCGLRAAAFSTETTQSSSGEPTAAAKGVDPLEALGRQPVETSKSL